MASAGVCTSALGFTTAKTEVVTNCDDLKGLKFSPGLPNAFTEHGAIMAASVVNSERAVQVSLAVVRIRSRD